MGKVKSGLIFVVGVLVALILSTLVAGLLLPEDHHASRTLVTKQAPQAIWDTITEIGKVSNPFFRFVSKYIIGHTTFMERYLTGLAGKFGEQAQFTK
jgi:hypothetical protein